MPPRISFRGDQASLTGCFEGELRARLSSIDRKLAAMSEQLLGVQAAFAWLGPDAGAGLPESQELPLAPPWVPRPVPRPMSPRLLVPGMCSVEEDQAALFEMRPPLGAAEEEPRSGSSIFRDGPEPPSQQQRWLSELSRQETMRRAAPRAAGRNKDTREAWQDCDDLLSAEDAATEHTHSRSIRGTLSWSKEKSDRGMGGHNMAFEMLSSFVIMLNAGYIGYSASSLLFEHAYEQPQEEWLEYAGWAFCFVFVVELGVRLWTEGRMFLVGPERTWNLLDAVLTTFSVVDNLLNSFLKSQSIAVAIGGLLRLSRFVRLVRIIRVMKLLPSLRLVVWAILGSMSSLFWCFFLITFLIYVFTVMILYAAVQYFEAAGAQADEVTAQQLKYYYGGVYKTMTALFMGISSGVDWAELMLPVTGMSKYYGPVFIVYIFFMYFGVLNVVVGTFVAATSDVASRDRDATVHCEMDKVDTYMRRVKEFFNEADLNKSGTLSWEEFEAYMQNPKVKAYFQTLELDVTQAHVVFELLDVDGSNEVTLDEFLEGCMRLKGVARSVDMNLLVFLYRRLNTQLVTFVKQTEKDLCIVKNHLVSPSPPDAALKHPLILPPPSHGASMRSSVFPAKGGGLGRSLLT